MHPQPQRWAVFAAWGAFLATIPSALWRVLMIAGLMPGTEDLRQYELGGQPALGYAYVFALSIVQLTTGFLTLGLVRPWGERIVGRRVPRTPVLIIAVLGGLAVTWLFTINLSAALAAGQRPDGGRVTGAPLALMIVCYAPIMLWGPLELIASAGYWQRRRRGHRRSTIHQVQILLGRYAHFTSARREPSTASDPCSSGCAVHESRP